MGVIFMPDVYKRLWDELNSQNLQEGFSSVDLLNLPPTLASLIGKIMRNNGITLNELAAEVHQPPEIAQKILDKLLEKGYLQEFIRQDQVLYKTKFTSRTRRTRRLSQEPSFLDALIENQKKTPS